MAKAGYVVAGMRYISDPERQMNPQIRNQTGVHDLRAAIRFFRKDAANENIFKVHTENIFIGGYGTGAFLAGI